MPGKGTDPVSIPPSLWTRPETINALNSRDVGRLFHLVRQYAGASQTQIAIACGMTQGKVSEYMKRGGRQALSLEVFERIADGLQMPDNARMALGLAPRTFTAAPSIQVGDTPPELASSSLLGSLEVDHDEPEEAGDPLRRRTFHRIAAAGLFSAVLADLPDSGAPLEGVEAFAAALAGYPDVPGGLPDSTRFNIPALAASVASAKRNYQACHYSTVIETLPGLLSDLRAAGETIQGDARLQVQALSAEAHHVAASILLKLDDEGLAWLAADRSMQAAQLSEDPVTVASSARIITHALMDDGHFGAATATASRFAARLDRDIDQHNPDSLSVYGSLLLRGAVAAGQRNDRGAVATMLDEAEGAGKRLGGDYNHRWTAFGPTNVQLHRVNISTFLGDAGQAIAEARRIELDRIPITERKAALLIDTSRALHQWGKHEKAYEILRAAEQLAPEEVSARPAVHRLLRDLLATSPPSTKRRVREFSTQIGVRL
jgi:transcriptional regulator with XRE-family HTH domain